MAVQVTLVGMKEDGTPLYNYRCDGHILFTGPISGTVTLPDGRVFDVTPDYIEVDSQEDALLISNAIGEHHALVGHPLFVNDPTVADDGFVHIPTEASDGSR